MVTWIRRSPRTRADRSRRRARWRATTTMTHLHSHQLTRQSLTVVRNPSIITGTPGTISSKSATEWPKASAWASHQSIRSTSQTRNCSRSRRHSGTTLGTMDSSTREPSTATNKRCISNSSTSNFSPGSSSHSISISNNSSRLKDNTECIRKVRLRTLKLITTKLTFYFQANKRITRSFISIPTFTSPNHRLHWSATPINSRSSETTSRAT